jgi:histidyl-tRNA synthetase
MTKHKGPRGAPDLLPPDSEVLTELEDAARSLVDRYGYRRIEMPIFEHTEVFLRTVGESSDVVVQKQMYTFDDARGRSLTLRPEGTAGAVRAFVEHRPDATLGTPLRLWYMGPYFRYERPAKGVDRQFFSVGVECIGSASPVMDAEVIALAVQFFAAVGIQPQLLLNTIGCPDDRKEYLAALREALAPHVDDLCDDCHRRLEVNPMRVFDCKIPKDRRIVRKYAPTIREYLCPECKEHHASVERILETLGVAWKDAPDLVRGLDYYTRTVFEFELPGFPTLGGGGRYDLLVEQLGGPPTPALGFGLGLSRTLEALRGVRTAAAWRPDVHVVWLEGLAEIAVATAMDLRRAGLRVTLSDEAKSLRSQLREANRLGARTALILGPDEVSRRVATVRDMESSEQREIALDRLVAELKS